MQVNDTKEERLGQRKLVPCGFVSPPSCLLLIYCDSKEKKETARSLKSLIQKLETAHISRLVPRKENSSLFGKKMMSIISLSACKFSGA